MQWRNNCVEQGTPDHADVPIELYVGVWRPEMNGTMHQLLNDDLTISPPASYIHFCLPSVKPFMALICCVCIITM